MTWYLINKNGIWEMQNGSPSKKIKSLPSTTPIAASELAPHNIIIDWEKADPETSRPSASALKRSKAAIDLVTKWEGYHRKLPNGDCEAYADPAHGWGVPTIGFGTTQYRAAGLAKYNRSAVQRGDTLTRLQAEDELNSELEKVERSLIGALTAPVTQGMFDALCSFCYNLGMSGAAKQIARVNAGLYEECAASFDLYVNANGRPLQGLINRRNDEEALFRSQGLNPGGSPAPQPSAPVSCTFKMDLRNASGLLIGTLDFLDSNSKLVRSYPATSGIAGYQNHDDVWTRGAGPIPSVPNQAILFSDGYHLNTTGIEGWAFPMRPDPIMRNGKVGRSEIMLHRDANVPGTAGCIGLRLSEPDYDQFVSWAKTLGTLPLKVVYT